MCSRTRLNASDCPMYECSSYSTECKKCKWLKRQRRIARFSQLTLAAAIVSYIIVTANIW